MSSLARQLGRLQAERSVFFLCDVQDRFRTTIDKFEHVIATSAFMCKAAKALGMPVVVTEQYPKALKHTCSEIDIEGFQVFEKTKFSMLTPEVEQHLKTLGEERKTAVLFGIEGHVCVYQTTLDLLERGWQVHLVIDGISSSRSTFRETALERLKTAGAFLTSSECVLFDLMRDTSHPKFKEVSGLIKRQNEILADLKACL